MSKMTPENYFKTMMIWTWVAMFGVGMAVGYVGAMQFDCQQSSQEEK